MFLCLCNNIYLVQEGQVDPTGGLARKSKTVNFSGRKGVFLSKRLGQNFNFATLGVKDRLFPLLIALKWRWMKADSIDRLVSLTCHFPSANIGDRGGSVGVGGGSVGVVGVSVGGDVGDEYWAVIEMTLGRRVSG